MTPRNILATMCDRVFNKDFINDIIRIYKSEKNAGEFDGIEDEYDKAMPILYDTLSDKQKVSLKKLENLYASRRFYAAKYGFACGLFRAFRVYFSDNSEQDGGFQSLLVEDLLMQPKMQRHHENYSNIQKSNSLEKTITDSLNEKDQLLMVSLACAWQNREYNAALQGFYLGYQAAYKFITTVTFSPKAEFLDKILIMEYQLGFTTDSKSTESDCSNHHA